MIAGIHPLTLRSRSMSLPKKPFPSPGTSSTAMRARLHATSRPQQAIRRIVCITRGGWYRRRSSPGTQHPRDRNSLRRLLPRLSQSRGHEGAEGDRAGPRGRRRRNCCRQRPDRHRQDRGPGPRDAAKRLSPASMRSPSACTMDTFVTEVAGCLDILPLGHGLHLPGADRQRTALT